jgi:hypothetical protein
MIYVVLKEFSKQTASLAEHPFEGLFQKALYMMNRQIALRLLHLHRFLMIYIVEQVMVA